MLNENKFHFIICYNDELHMQECIKYISFLEVPEGIETNIIGIAGADSITAGYNAAMRESDAKYKVYLHQDVFIVYKNFIRDVLQIFRENPEYGMLGVLGSDELIKDADYRNYWNIGMIDDCSLLKPIHRNLKNPILIESVSAISGIIMITQEDIVWREEIFKGFDFYDISQSIEFQKAGYKVGVPHQNMVWCNYDSSHNCFERCDGRESFCKEYKQYGYQYIENRDQKQQMIRNQKIEDLLPLFENTLISGELEKAAALIDKTMEFFACNLKLCTLQMLCKVMLQEKVLQKKNGFFYKITSISETIDQLSLYKFLLRRLEYDKPIEDIQNVIEWVAEHEEETLAVSQIVAKYCVFNAEKVIWKLGWFLEKWYGKRLKVHLEHNCFSVPDISQLEMALQLCKVLQTDITEYSTNQIESIYYTIEELNRVIYVVDWSEEFYKGYLDILYGEKNVERFLEDCQNWLKQVINYLQREEEQPLISIIVPVYNGELFVEDTLRSIMKQSYKNLQIIVVDDCSEDHSRRVIDKLAKQDKRIEKVYLKRNSNICVATNTGYKKVRGKYVALIGHDDIWKTDKIEKQFHFMEMNPEYAVCFTLCDIIDDEKQICNEKCLSAYQIFQQKNRTQKEWVNTLFFDKNVFCAPSAFIRKECIIWGAVYQYSLLQLQDYVLWLNLIVNFPFYILQEKLTLYRHFFKSTSNLSTLNEGKGNRTCHESNFILKRFLECLSDEKFQKYFSEYFIRKDAYTPDELKCERAFLLKKVDNFHCLDMFMELFESENTRNILENTYYFRPNDFYELNTLAFPYNYSDYILRSRLELANHQLQQYEKLIEVQRQQIEQLKQGK